MPKSVREPIQVYLSSGERGALNRLAEDLGISRSEVLRRGLVALQSAGRTDPVDAFLGSFDVGDAPADLARRHDDHLTDDIEKEWTDPPPASS